ncbi:RNA degradosome polyphosphate kinase [Oxobacter pfennigii]
MHFSSQNFINRELSWLEFNKRVLEEAQDTSNPLFERLKFLSIVSGNMDEFFMIRVGSLHDQIQAGFKEPDPAGLTPEEQTKKISFKAHELVNVQYNCYNRILKKALGKENILFLKGKELTDEQKNYVQDYFVKNIYPVLTPMVVDQSRKFPLVLNKTLNIALLLNKNGSEDCYFATVQVPSVLSRLVDIPCGDNMRCFMLLEDIIKMNLNSLFTGHSIITSSCYRITRNADLTLDEEEAEDLLLTIQESLRKRKWGAVIRLEIEKGMSKSLLSIIRDELEVSKEQIYEIEGPIDLTYLMRIIDMEGYDHLRYEAISPQVSLDFAENEDMFSIISKKDILLHHPYQSFDPIINLVHLASNDPDVLAIKQTLYRVSGKSPIIDSLIRAAENGKQVTVLVELKARFDEENNIHWAKRLEKAGCHVIYGLVGLKTHCKVLLIVRKEEKGIKRYVHLGTGNYNDVTARVYTDLGLFTSNPNIGSDASALFNMLSGLSEPTELNKLILSPLNLRQKFLSMIKNEALNARNMKEAKIIAKVNSLVDREIIEALYDASCAGVEIHLIVRGICCLRPGIPGVSERITVRSIIGRFLEHSRIFYFHSDGDTTVFLSSADWMNRNLDRRVELLFPIENENLKSEVINILNISLKDTVKARTLNFDGNYARMNRRNREIINSQEVFFDIASRKSINTVNNYKEVKFKSIAAY